MVMNQYQISKNRINIITGVINEIGIINEHDVRHLFKLCKDLPLLRDDDDDNETIDNAANTCLSINSRAMEFTKVQVGLETIYSDVAEGSGEA